MKILLIDNYDSFTYNLYQLVAQFNPDIDVYRNDKITLDDINDLNPEKILISPGPGRPSDSGICPEMIKKFHTVKPILGVCLGHQTIGEVFGAEVRNAPELMHGKSSPVEHCNTGIYTGLEQNFQAGRYHSLIVAKESLPDVFNITSSTSDGIIMGIKHKNYPLEGIQFHPESILTPKGNVLIKNWVEQ